MRVFSALWLPLSLASPEQLARRVASEARESKLCEAARPVGELIDCCDALEGDCWPEHGNRSESRLAEVGGRVTNNTWF